MYILYGTVDPEEKFDPPQDLPHPPSQFHFLPHPELLELDDELDEELLEVDDELDEELLELDDELEDEELLENGYRHSPVKLGLEPSEKVHFK